MDDFDPRIRLSHIRPLHEEFVKRKIPMLVTINNIMGSDYIMDKEVLDYVNSTDPKSWDIQLHGLEHEKIWTLNKAQVYRDVYCNLELTKRDFIHSNPTLYCPAWNQTSIFLEQVCKSFGLKVVVASKTIREFLLNWGTELYESQIYYWHWWTPDDVQMIPAVLDKVLKVEQQKDA